MDEPDPRVVAAARGGDADAFAALVRRYQAPVWRLSFQLVRDQALAEDVTQDTFVRAFRFLPRYRGDSKFSTWLFMIARNCAMDELRRAGRRSRTARLATSGSEVTERGDHNLRLEVGEALASLADDLRRPVVLIDMFGLSYREVAEIEGVPEGTVKSRVHRARELLVAALEDRPEERTSDG